MGKQTAIIGGGIAGLTTAIALKKVGIESLIFEAAPQIKPIGAGLALAANAIMAFQRLGLMEDVVKIGRVLDSFSIYDQQGKLISHADSRSLTNQYGVNNFTIHRAALHQFLLSKIDGRQIQVNKKAVDFVQQSGSVAIIFEDGSRHETEIAIIADGIHSAIRKKLAPDSEPRYAGYTCWRAVIDNSKLNLNESSESWGRHGRFGIVPLADRKIYWFACVNAGRNDDRFRKFTTTDLLAQFKDFHEPIPSILKETRDEDLIWNDIIDLKPMNRYAFNNMLLIGDAAHATTPNLGQGACQAIEDAIVVAHEIGKNTDVKQAFKNFEARRIKRTHDIVNTSRTLGRVAQWENDLLIGMRNFLLRRVPASINNRQLKKLYQVDF